MAWLDRLIKPSYVSPSGNEFPFIFTDLSREFTKKTSAFNFPDANGTYVQDFGRTGKRYPLRCIFNGPDCDLEADAFEDALAERGTGVLNHPLYGVINVVPYGAVRREDRLATRANEAVVIVTFYETIGRIYPQDQVDETSNLALKIDEFNNTSSEAFAEETDLDNVVEQADAQTAYDSLLQSTKSGLDEVASFTDEVKRQFDSVYNSINNGLSTLIGEPLTLAFQTAILVQAPARAAAAIADRLDAYSNLLSTLTGGADDTDENVFFIKQNYADNYLTAQSLAALTPDFLTRNQAVEAAEVLVNGFDDYIVWRESNYDALGLIDTGETYQALQELIALTEGYLINASFSLLQERTHILKRSRTIIDLVAEYYPDREDGLDFFINSNDLTGSQILELPKGTEIVYYV